MLQRLVQSTAVRGFATKATMTSTKAAAAATDGTMGDFKDMKFPKLQLHGVNARYANALYSVATKTKSVESVEKELKKIGETIHKDKNFSAFLDDPTIPRHKKKADVELMMKEAKFSDAVTGLFAVLADNGRLPDAKNVIELFEKIMSAERGEVQAVIVSADELSAAQLKSVQASLSTHIGKDETLVLETRVDPEILGGLTVEVGDKQIDLSLASKMNKIHQILRQPVA